MTEVIDLSGSGIGAIAALVEMIFIMGFVLAAHLGNKTEPVLRNRNLNK